MSPFVLKLLKSENITIWHYYEDNVTLSYVSVMCVGFFPHFVLLLFPCFLFFFFHPSHLPQNDWKNILRNCNKVQPFAFDNYNFINLKPM